MKLNIIILICLVTSNAISAEITNEKINEICILNYDIYNGCYKTAKDMKPISNEGCVDVTNTSSAAIREMTVNTFNLLKLDTTNEETFKPILDLKAEVCMDACKTYLKNRKVKSRQKYIAECIKNF